MFPIAVAPSNDGPFSLSDGTTSYTIPASLKPQALTAGRPGDEVGRAPYSDTWIRFGAGELQPEPLILRGVLFGNDLQDQLDALQAAAQTATSITWGERSINLQGGDADARERSSHTWDVTVWLLPTQEGALI